MYSLCSGITLTQPNSIAGGDSELVGLAQGGLLLCQAVGVGGGGEPFQQLCATSVEVLNEHRVGEHLPGMSEGRAPAQSQLVETVCRETGLCGGQWITFGGRRGKE